MFKKVIIFLLLGCLGVSLLTGCGDTGKESKSESKNEAQSSKKIVDEEEVEKDYDEALEAFKTYYKDVCMVDFEGATNNTGDDVSRSLAIDYSADIVLDENNEPMLVVMDLKQVDTNNKLVDIYFYKYKEGVVEERVRIPNIETVGTIYINKTDLGIYVSNPGYDGNVEAFYCKLDGSSYKEYASGDEVQFYASATNFCVGNNYNYKTNVLRGTDFTYYLDYLIDCDYDITNLVDLAMAKGEYSVTNNLFEDYVIYNPRVTYNGIVYYANVNELSYADKSYNYDEYTLVPQYELCASSDLIWDGFIDLEALENILNFFNNHNIEKEIYGYEVAVEYWNNQDTMLRELYKLVNNTPDHTYVSFVKDDLNRLHLISVNLDCAYDSYVSDDEVIVNEVAGARDTLVLSCSDGSFITHISTPYEGSITKWTYKDGVLTEDIAMASWERLEDDSYVYYMNGTEVDSEDYFFFEDSINDCLGENDYYQTTNLGSAFIYYCDIMGE